MRTSSHVAFSDESHWNDGRYRSIAAVTATRSRARDVHGRLTELLAQRSIHELKWRDVSSADLRSATVAALDLTISACMPGDLRVDVLLWDITDSRHTLRGRDDTGNLGRMYFHLLADVLVRRWPRNASWALYPDQQLQVDWDMMQHCVSCRCRKRNLGEATPIMVEIMDSLTGIDIRGIEQADSARMTICQIADLLAGMAVFSRERYEAYAAWLDQQTGQGRLFDDQQAPQLSRSDRMRCEVLQHFHKHCTRHAMGVSLQTSSGLRTMRATTERPFNFWWWTPQHAKDKAPVRQARVLPPPPERPE